MENESSAQRSLVFSYLTLRQAIGILGISLPFIVSLGALLFFGAGLQSSISSYYHTGMRDVLVGVLWTIGFFLLSYRGYTRADDIAGDLACVFAVGVAVFPTAPDGATEGKVLLISAIHKIFAALFFLTLIYFSLVLFTKTDPARPPTRMKILRNRVYRTCAYVMAACILLIAVYYLLPQATADRLEALSPIYWLEAVAILAFGVSWFVKGEAILKDEH